MKIVVLDGHALNPGDLSWAQLEALGSCAIYDRTPPGEVLARAADAEVVLTNKTVLAREALERLPCLRYIGVLATGYNVVDVQAAREQGIAVTNVPGYSTRSVAQLTFALLLELTHHVGAHSEGVRSGKWSRSIDFCYWDTPLVELDGLTLGIVGLGRIGQAVAGVGRALGMEIIASTPGAPPEGFGWVRALSLDALLAESDVVSLHCPLTPETARLMNAERLAKMKPSAFLLNTARGPLVDEAALADVLRSGKLAGAGVDVLSTEPPHPRNPLLCAPNCVVTPHIGWASRSARERLLATVVENVKAYLRGQPQNLV